MLIIVYSVVVLSVLESCFFFFKQKTAYEMRISDWSSDVCSSDLVADDPLAKAMELAAVIADRNPHAIRGAKRLCNMLADARDARLLEAASDEQVKVIRPPNQVEAVMAHMQKSRPKFSVLEPRRPSSREIEVE